LFLLCFVKTNFGKNNTGFAGLVIKSLMNFFAIKVEEGAKTIIYLASSPEVENISGKYFYQSKINKPSNFAENNSSAEKLWKHSIETISKFGLTI
jgi:hypothetical protein